MKKGSLKKSIPDLSGTVITEPEEKPFIVFGKPDIGPLEIEAVTRVLKSGWLSTGPVVRQLEQEFAAYMGSGQAVAVSSATMGLMLSMAVSCIGGGCEVITTPLTFAATINAILALGARPVFVDVDEHGNLDPEKIKPLMLRQDHKIKGVIPVHYTGAACDMKTIMHYAHLYDLKVIEDAAHAFGGDWVGPSDMDGQPGRRQKVGTISNFSVFSLFATKNITAGEGGIVMVKQGEFAERIRALAAQGMSANSWSRYGTGNVQRYEVMHPGYKGNMSDIHAAIALAQLRRWSEIKAKRSEIWNVYEDAFGWKEPGHSQHLFTIKVKDRDTFRQRMHADGIGTGVHFNALHLEPGYRFLGYKRGDFPNAERIGDSVVSLPISSTMTVEDAKRVAEAAKKYKGDL